MKDFREKLSLVPKKPGCYQMKDSTGQIIYVGKAKVLQNRLKSYFTGNHNAKTTKLVENIDDFEYIITNSELEAFLLELNLIKEHRPKYNIMLMDDKTYPYIYLTGELHPRLLLTRDPAKFQKRQKGKLYGPYPNVKACKDTVQFLNKVFPLRKCVNIPKKPCLYYSLGQCLAPCINKIEDETYLDIQQQINKFLSSPESDLYKMLEAWMYKASDEMEFEKAIMFRDMLESIKALHNHQKITSTDMGNRDIFGYYEENGIINIQVFHIRFGKVIMRSGEVFDIYDPIDDVLVSYITQFYQMSSNIIPDEVVIPYIENTELLESALNTKVIIPIKGDKKKLVDLVCENAKTTIENRKKEKLIKISKTQDTIQNLGELLNIPYPKRIEIFDNSNIQGTSSVSAMVTYIDGAAAPKEYRKYKVKTVEGADDFHTMLEVITRRYKRVITDNLIKPNLIIVDGGEPQVKAANLALKEIGVDIPLIGLVKDDRHKTSGIITKDLKEIKIDKKSNLFLLLEAMQDEVHRFAITFFRKTASNNMLQSSLEKIDGIGKNRRLKLLSTFDNIEEIKAASVQKLKSLGIPEDICIKLKNEL